MADAVAEGFPSFKIFMIGLARFDELAHGYMKVIAQAGSLGALTNIHAEDQCIISHLTEQLNAAGKFGVRHFADSRPRGAEGAAVQRAIAMARSAEARIDLVPLSCEESLAPIREARAGGQIVYGETRPIYLHLSRERFEEPDGERYLGWPPLREASQRQVLWDGLRDDNLQTVATDHVGFNLAQKKSGKTVDELLPGMSNLETMLPMLYHDGVSAGRISEQAGRGLFCQSRAAVRVVSTKRHDRSRFRRGHRHFRSRKRGDSPASRHAFAPGLGTVRRRACKGMACDDPLARRDSCREWKSSRADRKRQVAEAQALYRPMSVNRARAQAGGETHEASSKHNRRREIRRRNHRCGRQRRERRTASECRRLFRPAD
jgi:hypothetical protein